MADHRRDRVAHLLQHELARLLVREVADPRLAGVTVTAVDVTADLKIARVYVRTLAAEPDPQAVQKALRRAAPFLRGQVSRSLGMRVTPELRFEYDTLPDRARRLDTLLDETRRQHEPTAADEPPPAGATPDPDDDDS